MPGDPAHCQGKRLGVGDRLAVHRPRLIHNHDDRASSLALDTPVIPAHHAPLQEAAHCVKLQVRIVKASKLLREQPAQIVVQRHSNHVVPAVQRLLALAGLGHPSIAAGKLHDPPQTAGAPHLGKPIPDAGQV